MEKGSHDSLDKLDRLSQIGEIVKSFLPITSRTIEFDKNLSDMGIDSLDLYQIITICERKFAIVFSEREILGIRTIRELDNLVNSHKE